MSVLPTTRNTRHVSRENLDEDRAWAYRISQFTFTIKSYICGVTRT